MKKARWLQEVRWWNFLCPPCGHVAMRPCGQQPRLEHLVNSLLANTDFPKKLARNVFDFLCGESL